MLIGVGRSRGRAVGQGQFNRAFQGQRLSRQPGQAENRKQQKGANTRSTARSRSSSLHLHEKFDGAENGIVTVGQGIVITDPCERVGESPAWRFCLANMKTWRACSHQPGPTGFHRSTVEPVQSFLGAREIPGQGKGGAIFLGSTLFVALLFEGGAQKVVGFECWSFFSFGTQGQIAAQILHWPPDSCARCAAVPLPTP